MSGYSNLHILFGNYGLSNKKIQIRNVAIQDASKLDLQKIEIARGSGSSVVRSRNTAKTITLNGGVTPLSSSNDSSQILNMAEEINKIFTYEDRYLRTVPKSRITVLDDVSVTTGWTASNDATSVTLDNQDFQWEMGSVSFTVDVSNSANNYATITKTLSSAVNLSSKTDTGNFEFWLYIEDIYYVNTIDFRVGNDSSNYYSRSFSTNYEGKPLENGWNYFSVQWGNDVEGKTITETGTVTDSAIDYLYVQINYSSSATDFTAKLGGFFHVEEDYVRNYVASRDTSIDYDSIWYRNADDISNDFTLDLFARKGYAEGTHEIQLLDVTGITTSTSTQKIDLKGNFSPLIRNTFFLDDSTNLGDLRFNNLSTGQSIQWTNTWSDGDQINFDARTKVVTTNGEPQEFNGKIPNANLGINYVQMQVFPSGAATEGQTAYNTGEGISYNNTGTTWRMVAQSFNPSTTGTLAKVTVIIKGVLNPSISVELYGDSAGSPNTNFPGDILGKVLYQGQPSPYLPGGTYTAVDFAFDYAVTSGTTYWIVIRETSFTSGETAYWARNSSGGYAGGSVKTRDHTDVAWVVGTGDMAFEIEITPTPQTDIDWACYYKKLYH